LRISWGGAFMRATQVRHRIEGGPPE
jgi:hypothetical protein